MDDRHATRKENPLRHCLSQKVWSNKRSSEGNEIAALIGALDRSARIRSMSDPTVGLWREALRRVRGLAPQEVNTPFKFLLPIAKEVAEVLEAAHV